MTRERACIEQLSGKVDDELRDALERGKALHTGVANALRVSVRSGETRYALRCSSGAVP